MLSDRAAVRARALALPLLLAALVLLLASTAYGAEVYGKVGSFNGSSTFGTAGPGSSAVHGASKTLYVVDSSNQRILKFDVSDPAAPVPANFSALGSNAITQADGTALDLGPNANIAVDNSGGPQDGTLYLATNTINNAASRASAFAPTGAWRYDFRHDNLDDNNVVPSGGVLMPAAAIAVGPSGEIFRLGTPATLTSTGALYAPGAQPDALPTFRMVGSPMAYPTVTTAFFWPEANEVVALSAIFGANINLYSSPLTTLITDAQFQYRYPTGVTATAVATTATQGNVIARLNATFVAPARPARLAVMRFTSTGALNPGTVEEEFALGSPGSGIGLAYEAARDLVFSADTASKSIAVYGRVTVPDVEMLEPGYTDATTATLRARVDLRGTTVSACRFEWGATGAYGSTAACTPPSGSAPVTVSAPVAPVTVGSVYHARLVLTVNGQEVPGPDLEWQQPDLPDATTLGPGTITRAGTALLGGTVNPKGTRNTRYFVEYATNPSLSSPSVAPEGRDGNAGSGTAAVRRSTVVDGLQPATTYYFRLVAETGAGRTAGAIRSFRTFSEPSVPQPTSCPNSPFRTGDSAMLPDCRAWEKVSPDDKGGGITGIGKTFARADGDRVMFGGKFALDDSKSYGTTTTFMADRTGDGWTTQTLQEAASMPDNATTSDWNYTWFTPDLKWLVGGGVNVDLPGIDYPYNDPVYIRDVDAKQTSVIAVGDRKTVLAEGKSNRGDRGIKIAADRRVVIFKGKNLPVDSGARYPGNAMYWWTPEAGVTLASQGPNGAPVNIPNTGLSNIYAVSPDGERALWAAGSAGSTLFVGRRHGGTLEVTKANGVPQPPSQAALLQAWTPDLRYVYFTSDQPLTGDAPAGTNLYRYDTEAEQLENMLPNVAGGAGVQAVANLTPDGQHVYFYATAQLATGAAAAGTKLYRWHNGTVTLVTNAAFYTALQGYAFADPRSYERLSRVSRDGRYFLFAHQGSLAGTAMDSVVDPNGKRTLFRYDVQEQRVDCVSCSPTRHATDADAYLTQPGAGFMKSVNFDVPMGGERYFMSDRGVVLFTTAEPLTAGDVNGTYDSYLWDGDLRRITSGKSALPEWAETATEDFRDIFVHSYRQLVASDDDDSADLYTARVGGGLASQQVRPDRGEGDPCGGDRCQGPGTAPPPLPLLQSASVFGSGNLPALPTPVRSSVRVTRPKAVRARTVKLKARVSGAGRLRVTGKGLRQTAKTTKKAQTVTVTVRLSAWGTKQLRKRRSLTVNARVTFAPKTGAAASGRVKLTFRQPAATSTTTKKGGR